MEFSVDRKGALLVSGWFAAAGIVLCLPFLSLFSVSPLIVLAVWLFLCFAVLAPRLISAVIRVGGNHLTVRKGVFFPVTRRIPLRFLSGCHILQSPLQRMTGTCLFILYSSGCTTVLAGLRKEDAELLSEKLSYGGKLL